MRRPPLTQFDVFVATWLGSGYLPKAPGTWGTLAALPFGLVIAKFGGAIGLMIASVVGFIIGLWAAEGYMRKTQTHDPGAIVIDEVIGLWIAIIPLAYMNIIKLDIKGVVAISSAFLLFRFFDIFKPWPVSWADRMKGAMGVMLDDVLAGLYAALSLCIVLLVL